MVGVPGRSKGCRTCRRRHVKCDEARPICNRCVRGSFECEGYMRDLRFVDQTARTQKKAARKSTFLTLPAVDHSSEMVHISTAAASMPSELGLGAFEEDIKINFMVSKLFAGAWRFIPWADRDWSCQSSAPINKDTMRALSNVYFGRIHKEQYYIEQGLLHYCKALRGLCVDLQDPVRARETGVLRTAMCLATYEFIASKSNGGWIQHVGGVERILEFRGPEAHQAGLENHLFKSTRMSVILRALISRKRCFLDSPEWKTVPWALDPLSKGMCDHIQDILVDAPGIMEGLKALQTANHSLSEAANLMTDLKNRFQTMKAELLTWRIWWEALYPSGAHEVPASTSISKSTPPFETVIHFDSLERANEITVYNATFLLTHELGTWVYGPQFRISSGSSPLCNSQTSVPVPTTNTKHSNLALLSPTLDHTPEQVALEICRSSDYHLLKPHDSSGAYFLLFPLRMAFENLIGDEVQEPRRWIQNLMQEIADLSGFEISRALDEKQVIVE